MPTKTLNAKLLSSLKPPKSGRLELWDRLLPGFGIRVTDKDARTWFVMYRANTPEGRKQRRLKIGDARALDLAEARARARSALRSAARGIDPAEDDAPARTAAGELVATVAQDYLDRYAKKNTRASTYKETKRIFDVDILPAWGSLPLSSIARRDVNALLERIASRGAEVQANRTLARLKTFFEWAVGEEAIAASPVLRMKPKTREIARDRALSDEEVRLFWQACNALDWPFGPLFRLLLLTAQRRDEVGTVTYSEIDAARRVWTIPREKAKSDRAHEVALCDLAIETIKDVGEKRGKIEALRESPYLFTTTGKTPVSGFSHAKDRLDAEMERLARKARGLPEKDDALRRALKLKDGDDPPRFVPEFILHDLRRTATTGMAKLGIPPHVVDKILNHTAGTIRGVAAVYNRHAYLEERKTALEAWGRYVDSLMQPSAGNVRELRPAVAAR